MRFKIWNLLAIAGLICLTAGCTVRREPRALIEPTFSYLHPAPSLDQQPRETEPIDSVAALRETEIK